MDVCVCICIDMIDINVSVCVCVCVCIYHTWCHLFCVSVSVGVCVCVCVSVRGGMAGCSKHSVSGFIYNREWAPLRGRLVQACVIAEQEQLSLTSESPLRVG